ncbi:MFS transporter, partial [Halobium palmae]
MSRGRLFGTLCSLALLVNLARVMFAPMVDEIIDVFGVGEATVGLLVTLVWVGSAVPRLPTGWLLTRLP